jgi:hypothetical protein
MAYFVRRGVEGTDHHRPTVDRTPRAGTDEAGRSLRAPAPRPTDLHTLVRSPPLLRDEPEHPLASEGLLAVLHAAQALGARTHRRALVELTDGATLAVAIALSWEDPLDVA